MQYLVTLKPAGKLSKSQHVFSSFEEAMSFGTSNTAQCNVSIAASDDSCEPTEIVAFRRIA